MSTNLIVDLSADDCNDEILRKKINRKKMNELKRYIPFLEYISELDPVKNKNYKQLLRWLKINKEFPARMAATCENNIVLKYNKIKSTTEIPAHIVEVFTEKDAIIISDEDDEQPTTQNNSAQLSKDLETIDLEDDEPSDPSQGTILKKDEHSPQASSNAGSSAATDRPTSTANLNAKDTSLSISVTSTITHQSQANKDPEDSHKVVLEEGEILSDGDDIKENRDKNETQPKNIQKITTKISESIFSPSEDDIINQDLFKRIDCFDEDDHHQTPSNKEKNEEAKTPILRQKNLESELFSRRSPKKTLSDSLSANSEETYPVSSHKKKKKKHKHKKKNHDQATRYASEGVNHSERGDKSCRRETSREEEKSRTPKKSKKSSKRQSKEHKYTRLLYISDDEDDDVSVINKTKKESNFTENSNDSNRKYDIPHSASSSEPPTVVLSDSNDEEVSELSSVQEKSAKPPIEPVSQSMEVVPDPKSVVEAEETKTERQQIKEIPNITNAMQNINNMNIKELNDIYAKLCDATGIQLEELLEDLVGKSTQENKQSPQVDVAQTSREVAQTNFEMIASQDNLNHNNSGGHHSQYREENSNMFAFQQHQMQYRNQNQPYQLETYNHPQQEMQRQSHTNVQCQMPVQLPYQHNLRPGLNLNDPRIVQRLKQIKDSPIYNLNIRESASLLVSRQVASMPKRPLPVPEVTSKTAKTYGEHKRLRELERKRELERQASKTSTTTTNHTSENLHATNKEELTANKNTRVGKDNGAERCERNLSVSSVEETQEKVTDSTEKTIMSFSVNKSLSRSSSVSEDSSLSSEKQTKSKENTSSGRITPFEMKKVVNIVLSAIGHVNEGTSKKLKNLSMQHCHEDKALEKPSHSLEISTENKNNPTDGTMAKRREKPASKKRKESSNGAKKSPSKPFGIRELNNLNCTFLEYQEIFEKNCLSTYGGKRRCSVFPNTIRDQTSSDETSQNSDDKKSVLSDKVAAAPIQRRRQTCSALQDKSKPKKDNQPSLKVVFRRISEGGTFGIENPTTDSDEVVEIETEKQREPIPVVQQVKVKLKKLSADEIKTKINANKRTSTASESSGDGSEQKSSKSSSLSNAAINPTEEPILVPFSSEPVDCLAKSNPRPLRHLNDNINMTLNSTKFCAICNKRSLDLTNHYVLQHKTESYISRLTSAEIQNLGSQIKLATLNRKRYKTTCVFCQDELEVHNFVQFHAHYSYHTGEYGYKCDVCEVVKPYREDVKSHQLRTSRCRNGKVRTNYLYQSDLKVIYLYICKLCNFVQLNEANIHKHQRDHHSFRFEEPQHVKKCIICALDDVQVVNESLPSNEMESLEGQGEYGEPGGDSLPQEQEFPHEFPLDIKDVMINLENENNSESQGNKSFKCDDSGKENRVSAETPYHSAMGSSNKVTGNNDNVSIQKSMVDDRKNKTPSTATEVPKSFNKQMTVTRSGVNTPCVDSDSTVFSSNMSDKGNIKSASANEHIESPPPTPSFVQIHCPNITNTMKTYCVAKKQCKKPQIDLPSNLEVTEIQSSIDTVPRIDMTIDILPIDTTNNIKHENHIDITLPSTLPTPETLLGQLHGFDDHNNVMTIVHRKEQTSCVEHHQPYEETVDVKPNINEIKIENSEELEVSISSSSPVKQISYRKVAPGINYFGLYKCMKSDCWFSTNEAEKYVRHVDTHKVDGQKMIVHCAYCSSKSFCSQLLVRHIRTRHSMSLYQCSVCTYRSMVAGNVYYHIERNHRDVIEEKFIYKCVGRVRTLENKLAALKEKIKERVTKLSCRDCPAQYYSLSLMTSHTETTQHNINASALLKYACIFCELDSNSLMEMQNHLVALHPNDMCYVVVRELNNGTDEDSYENLKLINLTPKIIKLDQVRVAEFKEEVSETVQTTNKMELNLIERISPLLELMTEHTGVYRSELYKCTVCGGSFFTYDLWLSHMQWRHDINDKVTCPYCPQQISLEEVTIHFETHLRHEYFCLHCVKTFGSKVELEDHFDMNHKNFEKVIEKPIVYSNLRKYYIMKGDEGSSQTDWAPILENFIEVLRNCCIGKLYENRCSEWCYELVRFCFEDIDIPQYVADSGTDFKCLVNSCPFETPDENAFDLHLNQHTVPNNYDCPYCVKNVHTSWECIKDHYMLHRSNTSYLCCVCKFVHHNRSAVTEHIQKFHNSRDVPIITLWRDSIKCKISLSIVVPTNKIGFVTTTTCFCCGQGMVNGKGVMKHLFDAHGILLTSKCELCGDILLHREEIEKHAEKHGCTVLTFRYDILSPSQYDLCVSSISPFRIDIKRKMEKRISQQDEMESSNKRVKIDETLCVTIKQEINKGDDENCNMNNDSSFERPSCSIKCVNIDQLVSSTFKPIPNQATRGSISVKSVKDLQQETPLATTSNYHVQQSNNLSMDPPHQQQTQHINTNIQTSYIAPPSQQAPQMAPPVQYIPSQHYSNYKIQSTPHANKHQQPQQVQIIPNQPATSSAPQYYSNNNIPSVVVHQQTPPQFDPPQHRSSLPAQLGPSTIQPRHIIHSITLPDDEGVAIVSHDFPPPSSLPAQHGLSNNTQPLPNIKPIQKQPQNNIINITLPINKGTATITRGLPLPYTSSSYNSGPHCSYQNTKTVTPSSTFQISSSHTKPTQTQNCNQVPQTLEEIAKTVDHSCPEIQPICGNCQLECNNFVMLLSHFNAVHESNCRFIFRIDRRVECIYCPYRGSIPTLKAHNDTFHPGRTILCRSVIDPSRCGRCHGIFSFNPTPNNPNHPKCNCPIQKRVIADCITMESLQLLQKFGKKWFGFSCPMCNELFQFAIGCSNHIKTAHNQSDAVPKMWPLKCFLISCFMCDATAVTIQNIITHISAAHMINGDTHTLEDRLAYYKKIKLIYPRGFAVALSDLRNAGYDEDTLKNDIRTVDTLSRNGDMSTYRLNTLNRNI